MYKIKKEHLGSRYNSAILNRTVEIIPENINIILADKRFNLLEMTEKKPLKPVAKKTRKTSAKTTTRKVKNS